MSKPISTPPSFNYDVHVRDLNEKFGRLVKELGFKNTKGSPRYTFEVDFAYALHEITCCPRYLQGKMFDQASSIVSSLINKIKLLKETQPAA